MSFKTYLKENQEHSIEEYEAGSRALEHLKKALNELQIADKNKAMNYDDWKYYITQVQELISTDDKEAGLEAFLPKLMPK